MARDDDDDLYDEDFDFVDDDEGESQLDEESDLSEDSDLADRPRIEDSELETRGDGEIVDEYGRPEPAANYVVHVYEYKKFKRTIDRAFTPEDAESFATEYNRTGKSYGRVAVTGKNDAKPKKALE
jgi:hypothetical protein